MSDLRDRPNPSGWSALLDRSLPLLDYAFDNSPVARCEPNWTLGGGTALALRLAHRVSDDIDLFVGATDLRVFTPARNPHARVLAANMQFPGNYLRYRLDEGEIDFLPGPLLTSPGYSWEHFRGRPIALQTCEEVVLKKVRYRAASFKARDAFDLAAVASRSSSLGELLVQETGDRLPTLLTALSRLDTETMNRANIRALLGYEGHAAFARSQAIDFVSSLLAAMNAD